MPHLPRLLLVTLALALGGAPALARDASTCLDAIRRTEARTAIPAGLLAAVALGESGRYDSTTKRLEPWPWTVNNAGDGRYFASKAEAMAHVELLRRKGERNIDVGCMQVNLMHHPKAFASLDEAFDPATNVTYGGGFLVALRQETGSWERAVERYHTADPARGRAYRERIYARWQDLELGPSPAAGSGRRVQLAAWTDAGREAAGAKPGSARGFISLSPAPGRIAGARPGDRDGARARTRAGSLVPLPGAIRKPGRGSG